MNAEQIAMEIYTGTKSIKYEPYKNKYYLVGYTGIELELEPIVYKRVVDELQKKRGTRL